MTSERQQRWVTQAAPGLGGAAAGRVTQGLAGTGNWCRPGLEGEGRRRRSSSRVTVNCTKSSSWSNLMGTPASVACDPSPQWQAPEPRTRKKATANIFKGVDLLQIQGLFKNNGDESAEDRARIIWECAGDSQIANALRHLRRKRRSRVFHREAPVVTGDSVGVLSVQHFSQLCIEDGSYPACSQKSEIDTEDDPAPPSKAGTSGGSTKRVVPHRSTRSKRVGVTQDPSAYLHQIRH